MGWSNQQATTLDGQAFTYLNSTTEYGTGSALTIDADATLSVNSDVDVAAGRQVNVGGSASTASYAANVADVGTDVVSVRVVGDTVSRLLIEGAGNIWLGSGSAVQDVKLSRSAAGVLSLDGDLLVNGSSVARGVVARNYSASDLPAFGTIATTAPTAATVITTTVAQVVQGRIYRVHCPGLTARMNVTGGTGFQLTYTEDGSAPTATSTVLGAVEIYCPTGAKPYNATFGHTYTRYSATGPLKVLLSVWVTAGGGGAATTANTQFDGKIELVVEDVGIDPGVSS